MRASGRVAVCPPPPPVFFFLSFSIVFVFSFNPLSVVTLRSSHATVITLLFISLRCCFVRRDCGDAVAAADEAGCTQKCTVRRVGKLSARRFLGGRDAINRSSSGFHLDFQSSNRSGKFESALKLHLVTKVFVIRKQVSNSTIRKLLHFLKRSTVHGLHGFLQNSPFLQIRVIVENLELVNNAKRATHKFTKQASTKVDQRCRVKSGMISKREIRVKGVRKSGRMSLVYRFRPAGVAANVGMGHILYTAVIPPPSSPSCVYAATRSFIFLSSAPPTPALNTSRSYVTGFVSRSISSVITLFREKGVLTRIKKKCFLYVSSYVKFGLPGGRRASVLAL